MTRHEVALVSFVLALVPALAACCCRQPRRVPVAAKAPASSNAMYLAVTRDAPSATGQRLSAEIEPFARAMAREVSADAMTTAMNPRQVAAEQGISIPASFQGADISFGDDPDAGQGSQPPGAPYWCWQDVRRLDDDRLLRWRVCYTCRRTYDKRWTDCTPYAVNIW